MQQMMKNYIKSAWHRSPEGGTLFSESGYGPCFLHISDIGMPLHDSSGGCRALWSSAEEKHTLEDLSRDFPNFFYFFSLALFVGLFPFLCFYYTTEARVCQAFFQNFSIFFQPLLDFLTNTAGFRCVFYKPSVPLLYITSKYRSQSANCTTFRENLCATCHLDSRRKKWYNIILARTPARALELGRPADRQNVQK